MMIRKVTTGLAITLMLTGLAIAKDTPEQEREKSRKMAAQPWRICTSFNPPPRRPLGPQWVMRYLITLEQTFFWSVRRVAQALPSIPRPRVKPS